MTTYRIVSRAGADYGMWDGATPAEALAALHRTAGYPVGVGPDGELLFPDEETQRICGAVDDWVIERE